MAHCRKVLFTVRRRVADQSRMLGLGLRRVADQRQFWCRIDQRRRCANSADVQQRGVGGAWADVIPPVIALLDGAFYQQPSAGVQPRSWRSTVPPEDGQLPSLVHKRNSQDRRRGPAGSPSPTPPEFLRNLPSLFQRGTRIGSTGLVV